MEETSDLDLNDILGELYQMDDDNYPDDDRMDTILYDIDKLKVDPNEVALGIQHFIEDTGGNGPLNDYMVDYLVREFMMTKQEAVGEVASWMLAEADYENTTIFIVNQLGFKHATDLIIERFGGDEDMLNQIESMREE